MSHSGDFARWPHLGPIRPMDGGYRGGVGRRGVGQDTTRDDGIELRARARRYQLIPSRCVAGFVPKSAISEIRRSGQRENGRSGGNFLSETGCASWAVLGGIPSGWGQFGAVKKLFSSRRRRPTREEAESGEQRKQRKQKTRSARKRILRAKIGSLCFASSEQSTIATMQEYL